MNYKQVIKLLVVCWLQSLMAIGQNYWAFSSLVEDLRLNVGTTDLSAVGDITLDEPRLAYVNLTGFASIPNSKHSTRRGWMEFYDGNGHYFRKRITIHGQGGYSLRFPKNNFSCLFCEDEWIGEHTTDIRFGDWVKQDGFHFKAFYTDFSRGVGEIGYKIFEHFVEDRLSYWERAGYMNESRARCFPDGFPVVVYIEGSYLGVYAWQLKKHRKNMNMEKHEAQHIHLDGNIRNDFLFNGRVGWNEFEVRNPKDLYTKNGEEYDGNHPTELMSEASTYYPSDNDHSDAAEGKRRSAQVKAAILSLSNYHHELTDLENAGVGEEALKTHFEACFDMQSLIDYVLFFYFSANGDGSLKNWQWFTYDGRKWMVTPYDLDQTLGLGLYGQIRPCFFPIEYLTSGPFYWLHRYYQKEIRERWHQLRQEGHLTAEALVSIADDWCDRVGETFYDLEREQWPLSPCYCEPICNDGWKTSDRWHEYSQTKDFSFSTVYEPGSLAKLQGRLWEATETVQGVYPFLRNANPDSIGRLDAWLPERIAFIDDFFDYRDPSAIQQMPADEDNGDVVAIYTLSGMRVDHPTKGLYIFRYCNGRSRKIFVR